MHRHIGSSQYVRTRRSPAPARDRRRSGRRPVQSLQPNGWVESAGTARLLITIRDISLDGIGFDVDEPLRVGTVVRVGSALQESADAIDCVVVRQQWVGEHLTDGTHRYGARFIEPDARRIRVLAEHLAS